MAPDSTFPSFIFGGFMLFPLAVILLAVIVIFICKMVAAGKAFRHDRAFMSRIRDYISEGDTENALELCKRTPSPLGIVTLRGLTLIGKPIDHILALMEKSAAYETQRAARGQTWLRYLLISALLLGVCGFSIGLAQAAFLDPANAKDLYNDAVSQAWIVLASATGTGVFVALVLGCLKSLNERLSRFLHKNILEFSDLLNAPA